MKRKFLKLIKFRFYVEFNRLVSNISSNSSGSCGVDSVCASKLKYEPGNLKIESLKRWCFLLQNI
jgi:hypothetical protein